MKQITRRSTIKGIAAGIISLKFVGAASANTDARYILTVENPSVKTRIEREGFTVERELANEEVLQVAGGEDDTDDIEDILGVQAVAKNVSFRLESPELEEEHDEEDEPALWEWQWDKHVTDVEEAHESATGEGTTVGILDTGIDPDHPDLAPNIDEGNSELFSSGDPLDDHPWDEHGHGTHVAGIAGATGDVGVIGTAPDTTLVSLKVFWFEDPERHEDEDEPFLTTTTADILAAIDAAAAIGADAANLSLGTPPLPPEFRAEGMHVAYQRVIQHATRQGTVVVAAAGNSDANLQQGGMFTVPNSVPGAMSVSATGPNDLRTFYSNFGTNDIDVGAPGGGYETVEKTYEEDEDEVEWPYPTNLVLSTVPPDVYGVPYAYFAGTSMAAPQVSGTAALVRENAHHLNANQVENVIKQGANLVQGRNDPDLGAGRLNANDALDRL